MEYRVTILLVYDWPKLRLIIVAKRLLFSVSVPKLIYIFIDMISSGFILII